VTAIKILKRQCGYEEKPVHPSCGNCKNFGSELVYPAWVTKEGKQAWFEDMGYSKIEKNMWCTVHCFSVKKLAVCNLWRNESPVTASSKL
jgi:hypothetical protein